MCMILIYIFVSEQFILLIILITDIDNRIEYTAFGGVMPYFPGYMVMCGDLSRIPIC